MRGGRKEVQKGEEEEGELEAVGKGVRHRHSGGKGEDSRNYKELESSSQQ